MTNSSLNSSSVADFLRATPQFFAQYPELIPLQDNTDIGSLTHRHLEQLRQKIETQSLERQWLSDNALQNQKITERLHRLNVALIRFSIRSEKTFHVIEQELQHIFELTFVRIITAKNTKLKTDVESGQSELFETYGKLKSPQCSPFLDDETSLLRKIMPAAVASYSLIPLISENASLNGLLILGDSDKQRFTPHIDTLFLQQMAIQLSLLVEYIVTL